MAWFVSGFATLNFEGYMLHLYVVAALYVVIGFHISNKLNWSDGPVHPVIDALLRVSVVVTWGILLMIGGLSIRYK